MATQAPATRVTSAVPGNAQADAPSPDYLSEATVAGEQTLVPGVAPITPRDRLARLAEAPLRPKKLQQPLDIGLFDLAALSQLDLFGERKR